jgi:hypothetical protein
MTVRERYQNPALNDDIRLRLFSYNSNNRADVTGITKIETYFLDPTEKSESNPDGRTRIEIIDGSNVTHDEEGLYSLEFNLTNEKYSIGNYIDIWYITVQNESTTIENGFTVYSDLWFTSTIPITYDFNFAFRPNRLRKKSKRWLMIEVAPNVPSQSEIYSYYTNLATISPIKISLAQRCGECISEDNLLIEGDVVEIREKCLAYYFLDTTDMECGIYDVWFEMQLGESVYISEPQQLEITN